MKDLAWAAIIAAKKVTSPVNAEHPETVALDLYQMTEEAMEDGREVEDRDSRVLQTATIAEKNTKRNIEVPAVIETEATTKTERVFYRLLRKERQGLFKRP